MEYVYAALLLHKAGKEITEENISAIISAAGLEPDSVRTKALVAALEDVDIEEAISKAAITAPAAPAATPAETTAEETPAEEAKEEKKEEEEEAAEESGMEGLGALFG